MPMPPRLVLVPLVLLATACASLGSAWDAVRSFPGRWNQETFTAPEVRLQDVRVARAGLTGGALDVVLSVHNLNKSPLHASRLTYRLMIDTTTVGESVHADTFTIAQGDSSVLHFPVPLDYDGLTEAGRQLMGRGSVSYTLSGDLTVTTREGPATYPYTYSAQFTTFHGMRR